MSDDDVAIINAAADAAKMARLHGCAIDVHIDRWGRKIHVQVSPSGEVDADADGRGLTEILEPKPEVAHAQAAGGRQAGD